MKKALIIFLILFILTLAIPALAAFTDTPSENTGELATIFSSVSAQINFPLSFH